MFRSLPPACTALQLLSKEGFPYLFRTCDIDSDIFRNGAHLISSPGHPSARHAYMGVSFSEDPLQLLDGINDCGLCGGMLLLNEGTSLPQAPVSFRGVCGMEFVSAMLAECADTGEVVRAAEQIRILDVPIDETHVPAAMHFFFTDPCGRSVVLEAADRNAPGKLTAYRSSVGILTNSPCFPKQIENLKHFLAVSPDLSSAGISRLSLDGFTVCADRSATALSSCGTFPATYSPADRFVRAAVLKHLNDRLYPAEQMLVRGYNTMHPLFEPCTRGVFHYSRADRSDRKNSTTQYIIMYDLRNKRLFLRPSDALCWSSLMLSNLPDQPCGFQVCGDSQAAVIPMHQLSRIRTNLME